MLEDLGTDAGAGEPVVVGWPGSRPAPSSSSNPARAVFSGLIPVAPGPGSRLDQAKPAGGPPLERLKKSSGWLYGKAIDQGWLCTLIGSDVGFAER